METLFLLSCSSRSRLSLPSSLTPTQPPLSPAAQTARPSQRPGSPSPAPSAYASAPSPWGLKPLRNCQQDPHGLRVLSQQLHHRAAHPRAPPGILKGSGAWSLPCPTHIPQAKTTHCCPSLRRAVGLPRDQQTCSQESTWISAFAELLKKSQRSPQQRRSLLPSTHACLCGTRVPVRMMQS